MVVSGSVRFIYRNFDASKTGNWFAVPVYMAQIWSVQVVLKTVITNCTLELQMSNDGVNGEDFATAITWTGAAIKTGIDAGGLGISHFIFRVDNVADNADERVDVMFVGRSDTGAESRYVGGGRVLDITEIDLETRPA